MSADRSGGEPCGQRSSAGSRPRPLHRSPPNRFHHCVEVVVQSRRSVRVDQRLRQRRRKEGAIRLVADAKLALATLEQPAGRAGLKPNPTWRDRCEEVTSAWQVTRSDVLRAPEEGLLTQGQLIGVLQAQAEAGDTIVAARGGTRRGSVESWDATDGRRCHLEFGFSCMGYELPGALGVRMAQPDGAVVALIGDGTFVMQPSEIATALQEDLQVTFVISQNQGYQVIRRSRLDRVGRRYGNEFRHRDGPLGTGALTGGYLRARPRGGSERPRGARLLAKSAAEVRNALAEARHRRGPSVVVVPVDPYTNLPPSEVWWDVAPAEVAEQEWVTDRRRIYDEARRGQQWYG